MANGNTNGVSLRRINLSLIVSAGALLITLGGIVYAAGVQGARLNEHERRITAQESVFREDIRELREHMDRRMDRLEHRIDAIKGG